MNFIKIYLGLITILVLFLSYKVWFKDNDNDIIRTQGIIVEDMEGRPRILIGSPAPIVPERVRTDTSKVRQLWGKYFPKEYMTYYKEYNNDNFGIIVLDEKGVDRMAIGSPVPDPNIGKRIGPSTGIVINDGEGFERTGYGLLELENGNRVVLGLDNDNGTEGLTLSILEDGTKGLNINSSNQQIFVGSSDSSSIYRRDSLPFHGISITNEGGKKIIFNSSGK